MFLILMETYRLHISDAGFQRLFEKYENAYGMVQYKKLVQNIRGFMNEARRSEVQKAFEKFKKDKWGRVMMATIQNLYDVTEHPKVVNGEMTKTEAEFEFFSKFDKRHDQPINMEEFCDVYEWISANVNDDESFKTMVRKPWHIKADDVDIGCRRVLVWHSNGSQDIVTIGDDIPIFARKEFVIKMLTKTYGIMDVCDVKIV